MSIKYRNNNNWGILEFRYFPKTDSNLYDKIQSEFSNASITDANVIDVSTEDVGIDEHISYVKVKVYYSK